MGAQFELLPVRNTGHCAALTAQTGCSGLAATNFQPAKEIHRSWIDAGACFRPLLHRTLANCLQSLFCSRTGHWSPSTISTSSYNGFYSLLNYWLQLSSDCQYRMHSRFQIESKKCTIWFNSKKLRYPWHLYVLGFFHCFCCESRRRKRTTP